MSDGLELMELEAQRLRLKLRLAQARQAQTVATPGPEDAAVRPPPEVGAAETYVNRFNDAVPAGKPIVNLGATAGMQLAKLLGVGKSGVSFTPRAREELAAQGTPVDDSEVIPGPLETYRNVRDEREVRTEEGAKQNPTAAMFGTGSGILASVLAPLPKIAAGGPVSSAALTGGGYGGLFALTHGAADLTKGEFRQAARDVLGVDALNAAKKEFDDGSYGRAALHALGAGASGGVVGGTLASLLGIGANAIAGKAKAGQGRARADQIEQTARAAEKTERSQLGKYRSEIQSASRDLEVLERLAEGNDDLAWEASAFLGTPEAEAMRQMVGRGKLTSAPERLGNVAKLEESLQEASAARAPEAIAAAADEALAHPIRNQIAPRLKTYLNRSIPTAIGAAMGGPGGAAVGGLVSNTIGRPTTALANAIQSPAVRNMSWGALRRAAELAATKGVQAGEIGAGLPRPRRMSEAFAEDDAGEQENALWALVRRR